MSEARIKSRIWVSHALRLADLAGRPGAVLRKGDPDSGGILAVLLGRAGLVVLAQTRAPDGGLAWIRGTGPSPVDQETADAYVARQVKSDPDLWVVEFETPDFQPPFAAKIL